VRGQPTASCIEPPKAIIRRAESVPCLREFGSEKPDEFGTLFTREDKPEPAELHTQLRE